MTSPITPTTAQVRDNIIGQISAQLGQRAPIFPKAFTRVLATALAGVIVTLYKFAGFIFLQQFVRYASNEPMTANGRTFIPLQEWGILYGVGLPRRATQAQLEVSVVVLTQGDVLTTGTQLIGPNNVVYTVAGDVSLNAATVTAIVVASGDQQGGDGSGIIGNQPTGTELTFANPLGNVGPVATVTGEEVAGVEAETTDSYRARIILRLQRQPNGGSLVDFQIWAEDAAAVLNAYPYTGDTPGTVTVYIESATLEDGIPNQDQLDAALLSIQFDANGRATRAPLGTLPNTQPISRREYDITITNLTGIADLAAARDEIERALTDYFTEREPFITGLSTGTRLDTITQSEAAGLVATIVAIRGGTFDGLTLNRDGNTVTRETLPQGVKAKRGDVTYA